MNQTRKDMNFFAQAMRYQALHGQRSDDHAVVSCTWCHGMLLAMNLDPHVAKHARGRENDPTVRQAA